MEGRAQGGVKHALLPVSFSPSCVSMSLPAIVVVHSFACLLVDRLQMVEELQSRVQELSCGSAAT